MNTADKIIEKALEKSATVKWDKIKGGGLKGTYNNCLNFLSDHFKNIRYNEFSHEVEINNERLEDNHLIQIKEAMRSIRLEPSIGTISEAVTTVALNNRHHPVKEYLLSLKWDNKPRLRSWLVDWCGAEDCDYTQTVGQMIFLAIVNRVFRPGCQYDHMPILEGDQGIGKSSIVRAIGGEWYKEVSLIERDRDTVQKMQGAIIVEIAELAAFGKRDIDSLKAFITHPSDFARFAYARNDKKYPRQSTFIGTVNPDPSGYLHDDTGNRRFCPVMIGRADLVSIINNRDNLFAEAYQMYLSGVPIYFKEKHLISAVKEQQMRRESQDPWADIIVNWARQQLDDTLKNLTCSDIYVKALEGRKESCDRRATARISSILKKLGCGKSELKSVYNEVGRYWDISILAKVVEKGGASILTPPVKDVKDQDIGQIGGGYEE